MYQYKRNLQKGVNYWNNDNTQQNYCSIFDYFCCEPKNEKMNEQRFYIPLDTITAHFRDVPPSL